MAKVVFRAPDIEGLAEADFIGMDLHYHTDRSLDSVARINNVIRRAKKMKIGLAMTDHNQTSGGIDFFKNKQKVPVIPAVELTSKEGTHTLLYFYTAKDCRAWTKKILNPLKKKDPFRLPATTEELYESAQDYNAVICAPHPYGPGATGVHKIRITKKMLKMINVVEGLNAYNLHSLNVKAVKWADRIKKPVTAGSDGHVVAELGQALTFCQAHNVHEFLDELKRGHCIAMGKENSIYEKAIIGIEKEHSFVGRAHKKHIGMKLVKDQMGAEWNYLKKKLSHKFRHKRHEHFHGHHG